MIIEIPDKATNGDVLKAVFDCDVTELKAMTNSAGKITVGYEVFLYNHRPKKEGEFGFGTKQKFDGTMWWNSPYKENKE